MAAFVLSEVRTFRAAIPRKQAPGRASAHRHGVRRQHRPHLGRPSPDDVVKDLLLEACARLAGLTKMTRDEMRLASYPDSMPEIEVCQ